ncbi:MAG TPA: zinc-binding dehydrogenase [Candidatus Sulfomarinibacteraceae bacterium]|nr:zinc-binding dehydrogenase [Candidatus Sulfomarinibacteraceae bacterium]
MKALLKYSPGPGNLAVRDIPEPDPGPGQVRIEVKAAGICGTDLHIYKDEFKTRPPVVLGHEVAGRIDRVGPGVEGLTPGDRVTTETYFSTCGRCRYCRRGRNNLCLERRSIGSAVDGGFTRYLVVPAQNVHHLPPNVDFEAGALTEPLACVVHGVLSRPSVRPGDVAIIAGPGAIGLLTLQLVKAAGATAVVLGTGRDGARLQLASELGADHALNVEEEDPAHLLGDITVEGLGADVVYECSGAGPAARQLLRCVRRRGRYVQIGLFGRPISWNLDQVCYKELAVSGSNASVPQAWIRALQLMAQGVVHTDVLITHRFDITQWEEAFALFDSKQGVKTLLKPVT